MSNQTKPQVSDNTKQNTERKGKTLSINYDQEQVCDLTGDTVEECGVIFTTGTINVGRLAIKKLSSQLAEWERQQRG